MIRVIVVIPTYLGGGAETVTDDIVRALRKRGFEFVLVTQTVIAECRKRVETTYDKVIIARFQINHYSKETSEKLAELIRPLDGNVLWLIGDEQKDISLIREALQPDGKVIYHLHSMPFFTERLKMNALGKGFSFKRLREKLFHTYQKRYVRRSCKTAAEVDAFVTLSKGYSQKLVGCYPQYSDKFVTVYNPTRPYFEATEKRDEIVFLGRLSFADKRVDRLLRIFEKVSAMHPNWSLKIVGDGPERANLEELVKTLNLKNVDFVGFVSNPVEYLKTASIIAMTSELEGWPMALIEGMQYGVVPIAYGCSAGVSEILADGRGIDVTPGDEDAYVEKLSFLMSSPEFRAEAASKYKDFISSLSIEKTAQLWEEIFKSAGGR